jgi:hypothetical protein
LSKEAIDRSAAWIPAGLQQIPATILHKLSPSRFLVNELRFSVHPKMPRMVLDTRHAVYA